MIRDYGEDVGSEEERSIESEDLAKDDVSDLLDETEEVRRPKEPGQLENPRDLSDNTGSVPIYIHTSRINCTCTTRIHLFAHIK